LKEKKSSRETQEEIKRIREIEEKSFGTKTSDIGHGSREVEGRPVLEGWRLNAH
jgi:hypothetical protein